MHQASLNKKILIVEDDENVAFTIGIHLQSSGYQIITAKNGEEGIKQLKNNNDVNLVITDIRMPVLDGLEFCREIRKNEAYKFLPVLILTASSDSLTKYQGFSAGTDDYLTKPFDPIELLLRVQALLRRNVWPQPEINKTEEQPRALAPDFQKFVDSKIEINGKEIQFTFTEFDIFYYLYTNSDRFITYQELLSKVLDYPHMTGSPEIVRTHIRNIRNKLELDPHNPQILMTSNKKGYYLDKKKLV